MSRGPSGWRLCLLVGLAGWIAVCVWLVPSSSAVVNCEGVLATIAGATSGDDTLEGTAGPDVILGLGGNDRIYGFGGDDLLCGGPGKDAIRPGLGNDGVDGGHDQDSVEYYDPEHAAGVTIDLSVGLAAGAGGETDELVGIENIAGSDGPDTMIGSTGNNTIYGFGGDDLLSGGPGKDAIRPGLGNDDVDGGPDPDSAEYKDPEHAAGITIDLSVGLAAGGGGETDELVGIENIAGSDGPDTMIGNARNNTMIGFGGNDRIEGGEGDADAAWYPSGKTVASLAGGSALGVGQGQDQLSGIEILEGSDESDTLIGDGEINVLNGLGGDDLLYGRGGNDSLRTGGGSDYVLGGEGPWDSIEYTAASTGVSVDLERGTVSEPTGIDRVANTEVVIGSKHADDLRGDEAENIFFGGDGDDLIDGREGADTVAYFASTGTDGAELDFNTGPIDVDLQSGGGFNESDTEHQSEGDTLIDIEDVWGSRRDDVIHGDRERNQLFGDSGDDDLFGRGNDDAIVGDAGNDRIVGGAGDGDFVDYLFSSGSIRANLVKGNVVVRPVAIGAPAPGFSSERDRVRETEIIAGTGSADVIRGSARPDLLLGGGGVDRLFGRAGDDALRGGEGAGDFLSGGPGRDHCKDDRRVSCERKVLPKGLRAELLQALAQRLRDIGKKKHRNRNGIGR